MSKEAVYSRNEESLNKIKGMHPLGIGQSEDVANACVYLLSEASRWVTGTNLIVDGGYTAR
jgi:NAD(P)-dependent dehydrogenase (short-subunit alcohol dehydrogenase family)